MEAKVKESSLTLVRYKTKLELKNKTIKEEEEKLTEERQAYEEVSQICS